MEPEAAEVPAAEEAAVSVEVEAAVDSPVEAEEPPHAARDSAIVPAIAAAINFLFMVILLLFGCSPVFCAAQPASVVKGPLIFAVFITGRNVLHTGSAKEKGKIPAVFLGG